mgnify:CR=1 FL=1
MIRQDHLVNVIFSFRGFYASCHIWKRINYGRCNTGELINEKIADRRPGTVVIFQLQFCSSLLTIIPATFGVSDLYGDPSLAELPAKRFPNKIVLGVKGMIFRHKNNL